MVAGEGQSKIADPEFIDDVALFDEDVSLLVFILRTVCPTFSQTRPQYYKKEKRIKDEPLPKIKEIFKFFKTIFDLAQFSPESNLISLVYINRLISFTGMRLNTHNWRPVALLSLL